MGSLPSQRHLGHPAAGMTGRWVSPPCPGQPPSSVDGTVGLAQVTGGLTALGRETIGLVHRKASRGSQASGSPRHGPFTTPLGCHPAPATPSLREPGSLHGCEGLHRGHPKADWASAGRPVLRRGGEPASCVLVFGRLFTFYVAIVLCQFPALFFRRRPQAVCGASLPFPGPCSPG